MNLIKRNLAIQIFVVCLFLAALAHAGSVFYVYKDRKGNTVIEDQIPPELMHRGYKVVNSNGITLKTVPPTKKERKKPQKPSFDANTLPASDLLLLRSYSSVHDIEAARDSRVTQVHEIINSTMSHALAFERNLSDMKARQKQLSEAGKLVSPKLLSDIRLIEDRIAESRAYLSRKKTESTLLLKQYEQDIRRFKQLQAQTQD